MLSVGPLLSDLSVGSDTSVVDRFWPFVVTAFLVFAGVAFFCALRNSARRRDSEEVDEDSD